MPYVIRRPVQDPYKALRGEYEYYCLEANDWYVGLSNLDIAFADSYTEIERIVANAKACHFGDIKIVEVEIVEALT